MTGIPGESGLNEGYSALSPRYSVTTRHVVELRQTPTLIR